MGWGIKIKVGIEFRIIVQRLVSRLGRVWDGDVIDILLRLVVRDILGWGRWTSWEWWRESTSWEGWKRWVKWGANISINFSGRCRVIVDVFAFILEQIVWDEIIKHKRFGYLGLRCGPRADGLHPTLALLLDRSKAFVVLNYQFHT